MGTTVSLPLLAASAMQIGQVNLQFQPYRITTCFDTFLNSITGFGDFATTPGVDCDINETSTKVLTCGVLASSVCCIALISRHLLVRSILQKTLCYITYEPKTIFPWIFFVQLWSQVAFSITKLMYRSELAGKTLLATLFGEMTTSFAFLGLAVYFLVILKFLRSFAHLLVEDRRNRVIEFFATLRICCGLMPLLIFMVSTMVVVGIRYEEQQKILAVSSLCVKGCMTLFYGFLTTSALRYLRKELQDHVKVFNQSSDGVRLVLKRLTWAYYMLLVMSFLMGMSYLVFCTDYLLRKATYLVIWLQFSWPPASTILILTVSRISNRVEPSDPGPTPDFESMSDFRVEPRSRSMSCSLT
jgi:hypothetical protein